MHQIPNRDDTNMACGHIFVGGISTFQNRSKTDRRSCQNSHDTVSFLNDFRTNVSLRNVTNPFQNVVDNTLSKKSTLEQRNLVVPAATLATHRGGLERDGTGGDAHLVEHLLGISVDDDVGSVDLIQNQDFR